MNHQGRPRPTTHDAEINNKYVPLLGSNLDEIYIGHAPVNDEAHPILNLSCQFLSLLLSGQFWPQSLHCFYIQTDHCARLYSLEVVVCFHTRGDIHILRDRILIRLCGLWQSRACRGAGAAWRGAGVAGTAGAEYLTESIHRGRTESERHVSILGSRAGSQIAGGVIPLPRLRQRARSVI